MLEWDSQFEPDDISEIIRPPRRGNHHIQTLVVDGYLSLTKCSFGMSSIPTADFRRIRRDADESEAKSALHTDIKTVGGWLLQRLECESIEYEVTYPRDGRVADVACPKSGFYIEVGMIEDSSRLYENLNLDIKTFGSEIQSVFQRYPEPTKKIDRVHSIFYIPYPTEDIENREWKHNRLQAYRFTRTEDKYLVPNRNNRYWGED